MGRQLLCPYAFDVGLPLDLLSTSQCHMHQDDPIAAHRQVKTSAVMAFRALGGFAKHRGHAWVRHVPFQLDSCARHRLHRGIQHFEIQSNGSCLDRLRKDL
jgi:hypothetical protein